MKRTQIQLDDRTYEAVRRKAFDERRSFSAVVRETLESALLPPREASARARTFRFVGAGRSRQSQSRPVSTHHDQALAASLMPGGKKPR